MRGHYLHYLQKGISYGITDLKEYYQQAVGSSWHARTNRFIWYYAAGLFKETTTIDVMYIRTVDPTRIFSHQENKDFLQLMLLCSEPQTHKEAEQLLLTYSNGNPKDPMARFMKQYYRAALRYYKH